MSRESYIRGFCKVAEAAGVSANSLAQFVKTRPSGWKQTTGQQIGGTDISDNGFAGRFQRLIDRVGSAIGSKYQRYVDGQIEKKRQEKLYDEAMNAFNRSWQKFAPVHSPEQFRRFAQKYIQDKRRSAATRLPAGTSVK